MIPMRYFTTFQKMGYVIIVANLILATLMIRDNPFFFVTALLLAIVYPIEVYRRNRKQESDSGR